jgi:hypothetical protein
MSGSKMCNVRFVPNVQPDLAKPLAVEFSGPGWEEKDTTVKIFEMDAWGGKREGAKSKDDLLATFKGKLKKDPIAKKKALFRLDAKTAPVFHGKSETRTDQKAPIKIAFEGAAGTVFDVPLVSDAGENEGQHWELGIEVLQGGNSVFKTKHPATVDTGRTLSLDVKDSVSDKAIPGRAFVLAVRMAGDKLKLVRGKLDQKSHLTVHHLPKGRYYLACLVKDELPKAFEKLADDPKSLTWARIFGLRYADLGTDPKKKKVKVEPTDSYHHALVPQDKSKKLGKLDVSIRQLGKNRNKKGFKYGTPDELEDWCYVAQAFMVDFRELMPKPLSEQRSEDMHYFAIKLFEAGDHHRLCMAFGKLMHGSAKGPNCAMTAAKGLVWSIARVVNANKKTLVKGELPPVFPCLFAGLKLGAKSVKEDKGLHRHARVAQVFSSYSLALGHQILATTTTGFYDKKRMPIAKKALLDCYKVAKRKYIDVFDPKRKAGAAMPVVSGWGFEREKGSKRKKRGKKKSSARPDWRPTPKDWRARLGPFAPINSIIFRI